MMHLQMFLHFGHAACNSLELFRCPWLVWQHPDIAWRTMAGIEAGQPCDGRNRPQTIRTLLLHPSPLLHQNLTLHRNKECNSRGFNLSPPSFRLRHPACKKDATLLLKSRHESASGIVNKANVAQRNTAAAGNQKATHTWHWHMCRKSIEPMPYCSLLRKQVLV